MASRAASAALCPPLALSPLHGTPSSQSPSLDSKLPEIKGWAAFTFITCSTVAGSK